MSSLANEILSLQDRSTNETQSHLQHKAELTRKFRKFSEDEELLLKKIDILKEKVSSGGINVGDATSLILPELLNEKKQIEEKINRLEKELKPNQDDLAQLKVENNGLNSEIQKLEQERKQISEKVELTKQKKNRVEFSSIRIKNELQKQKKVKVMVQYERGKKENLITFLNVLNRIEELIKIYISAPNSETPNPEGISEDIFQLLISAHTKFTTAQTKFDPNRLTPFLLEANEAYRDAISVLILLSDNLPNSLVNEDFNHQIFTIVDLGLQLNTRHLTAIETMLSKLEKGVEIAPLASFSNEIKDYFDENLTLLRLIRK